MSITRAPRPESNFYVLDKRISEDARLSWAARGLLVFLLGKPDHWQVSVQHLINQTKESAKRTGRDGTYRILKELEIAGYLHRTQQREAGTFGHTDYIVTESPHPDSPHTEKPYTAKPYPANPTLVSTEGKQGLSDSEIPHPDKSGRSASSLPDCPHQDILALWAEILPEAKQPAPNLWAGTARADALAARWRAGFKTQRADGKPFYTTRDEGIDWWRRFFGYIAGNEFLTQGHRWFGLDWVVKKTNFIKILERNYEDAAA